MELYRYIDWQKMWDDEVFLDDYDEEDYPKIYKHIQALKECDLDLMPSECVITLDTLHFTFGSSFDQTESDSVGSYVNVTFVTNHDMEIIDSEYDSG